MIPHDIRGNWRASGDLGSIEALLMICSCSAQKTATGLMLRGRSLIVIHAGTPLAGENLFKTSHDSVNDLRRILLLSGTHRGGQQSSDPFSASLSGILFPFWRYIVREADKLSSMGYSTDVEGVCTRLLISKRVLSPPMSKDDSRHPFPPHGCDALYYASGSVAPASWICCVWAPCSCSWHAVDNARPDLNTSSRVGMKDVSVVRWRFDQPLETNAVTRFPWRRRRRQQQRLVGEPRLGLSDQGF
ncbi:hypothetical protein F5X96DRAFT_666123 [Biscogniauxia mediterranea]|nr:hypothetical protein F5X96DRAFT_666123 [Biscogniauxia mediterranea]